LLLDSIHYMSPELVKGDVLDHCSDQYSLGVIAWQALTGALPFRADSPITLLSNIAFEPADLRGVSGAIAKTFERVLSKFPSDRFASTAEFASAFQEALSHADPAPVVIPSRLIPPEEKKSLLPWILGAAVIVAIVIAGAILVTRTTHNVAPPQPVAAPQVIPSPPPPTKETAPVVVRPKPKLAKKAAPTKDTIPEAPKLKPIDPKVVHQ
jgi:serine/threonine-protein kinase